MDIISVIIGVALGIIVTILYFLHEIKIAKVEQNIKDLSKIVQSMSTFNKDTLVGLGQKIEQMKSSIPTPAEVAKEVIKIKLPISDLPPEMQEQIRLQSLQSQQPPQGRNPLVG